MNGIPKAISAHDLEALLAKRYCAPEWAFMTQVANRTGGGSRYADAVAMNLYPSRGLALHGFEIKVYRNDWLNELKNPEKAEEIAQYCDHWWIVAPAGLVREGFDVFPSTWGLIEYATGQLRTTIKAPKLEAKPLTKPLIASIFRRFSETVPQLSARYVSREDVEKLAKQRAEEIVSRTQGSAKEYLDRYESLHKRVIEFEQAVGYPCITGDRWDSPAKTGARLRALTDARAYERLRTRIAGDVNFAKAVVSEMESLLSQMPAELFTEAEEVA